MLHKLITLIALGFVPAAFATSVQDFSGMHGCWRGNGPAGVLQESWSKVSGGMMFGSDQLMDGNGNTLGWGAMTIISKNSRVQFGYSDNGAAQQVFDLAEFNVSKAGFTATFTNDSSTDVTKVIFSLTDGKTMRVQLFGGKVDGLDLTSTRVSDTADCP